jgi:hypothetical protein
MNSKDWFVVIIGVALFVFVTVLAMYLVIGFGHDSVDDNQKSRTWYPMPHGINFEKHGDGKHPSVAEIMHEFKQRHVGCTCQCQCGSDECTCSCKCPLMTELESFVFPD